MIWTEVGTFVFSWSHQSVRPNKQGMAAMMWPYRPSTLRATSPATRLAVRIVRSISRENEPEDFAHFLPISPKWLCKKRTKQRKFTLAQWSPTMKCFNLCFDKCCYFVSRRWKDQRISFEDPIEKAIQRRIFFSNVCSWWSQSLLCNATYSDNNQAHLHLKDHGQGKKAQ